MTHKKSCIYLFVLLMLCFLSIAPAFSETEPNNNFEQANVAEVNQPMQGSLIQDSPQDIYDVFQINFPQDGIFQASVVSETELDIIVRLFDGDRVSQMGSSNTAGKGANEGVQYRNIRAGTYFVIVQLLSGSGSYTFTPNFAPVTEIDEEPNNQISSAQPLPLNGQLQGHIGYHGQMNMPTNDPLKQYTDHRDFFSIQVPANGEIELSVFPENTLRVHLELRDSNGTYAMAAKNDNGKGGSETFIYNRIAAGTYFVKLVATEGYGSYVLTSQFTEQTAENDLEPNNQLDEITQVINMEENTVAETFGGEVYGQIGYFGQGQRDYTDQFQVSLPAFGNLKIESLTDEEGLVSVSTNLFDTSGRYMGSGTINSLPTGDYILMVNFQNNHGPYHIQLTHTPAEPPALVENTLTIQPNETLSNISLSEDQPIKVYQVVLPSDGQLTITSQYTDDIRAHTSLHDNKFTHQHQSKESYYSNTPIEIGMPNLLKGVYLIQVQRISGAGNLTLTTEFTPVEKIDNEPNDHWCNPDLSPVETRHFEGHVGYGGNGWTDTRDYFYLQFPDPGSIVVRAKSTSTLRYRLNLFEYQEQTYRSLQNREGYYTEKEVRVEKVNVLGGIYMIGVERINGYGSYDVDIEYTPNRSTDPEPNDRYFQAVDVPLDVGMIGHLGYERGWHSSTGDPIADDYDWYRIEIPEDGRLDVNVHGDANLRQRFELYHDDARTMIQSKEHYYTNTLSSVGNNALKAGVYYLHVYRYSGYGTYHFYIDFTPENLLDQEPNDLASQASTFNTGQLIQGSIGYNNRTAVDVDDFYKVTISEAGTYKFTFQQEPSIRARYRLYVSTLLEAAENHEIYYGSGLRTEEIDLTPGTYYLHVWRNRGFGQYTISLSPLDRVVTGVLSGVVSAENGFPLAEVNVNMADYDWKTETDFAGLYSFGSMMPGTYRVNFEAGSKYYAASRLVDVVAGETTQLDVTLPQSSTNPPEDVERLYGFARDRYLHFIWSPSRSFDVADGGGYKLYINNEEPIDLGAVLRYYSHGFINGETYECRLTVYDKFGNESVGKTVMLTPDGTVIEPAPSPTPLPNVTPSPTPTSTPTPTLTPTPQPGQTVTPEPTNTPEPGVTPIPTPAPVQPVRVYEFAESDVAAAGWFHQKGGFVTDTPPGEVTFGDFATDQMKFTEDGRGMTIKVYSGEVSLLYTAEPIDTQGNPALMRLTFSANAPDAGVWLGSIKGSMADGQGVDGSLALVNSLNTAPFLNQEERFVAIYQPANTNFVTPIIQVAGLGENPATVYIDKVEIFVLESDRMYQGDLFFPLPHFVGN